MRLFFVLFLFGISNLSIQSSFAGRGENEPKSYFSFLPSQLQLRALEYLKQGPIELGDYKLERNLEEHQKSDPALRLMSLFSLSRIFTIDFSKYFGTFLTSREVEKKYKLAPLMSRFQIKLRGIDSVEVVQKLLLFKEMTELNLDRTLWSKNAAAYFLENAPASHFRSLSLLDTNPNFSAHLIQRAPNLEFLRLSMNRRSKPQEFLRIQELKLLKSLEIFVMRPANLRESSFCPELTTAIELVIPHLVSHSPELRKLKLVIDNERSGDLFKILSQLSAEGALKNLEYLEVELNTFRIPESDTQIEKLSHWIASLRRLRGLKFTYHGDVVQAPVGFSKLPQLEELKLSLMGDSVEDILQSILDYQFELRRLSLKISTPYRIIRWLSRAPQRFLRHLESFDIDFDNKDIHISDEEPGDRLIYFISNLSVLRHLSIDFSCDAPKNEFDFPVIGPLFNQEQLKKLGEVLRSKGLLSLNLRAPVLIEGDELAREKIKNFFSWFPDLNKFRILVFHKGYGKNDFQFIGHREWDPEIHERVSILDDYEFDANKEGTISFGYSEKLIRIVCESEILELAKILKEFRFSDLPLEVKNISLLEKIPSSFPLDGITKIDLGIRLSTSELVHPDVFVQKIKTFLDQMPHLHSGLVQLYFHMTEEGKVEQPPVKKVGEVIEDIRKDLYSYGAKRKILLEIASSFESDTGSSGQTTSFKIFDSDKPSIFEWRTIPEPGFSGKLRRMREYGKFYWNFRRKIIENKGKIIDRKEIDEY